MTTQREILFDELTAKDVAERLRLIDACNNYLNAVALTVARLNGAGVNDRVMLNREGTGIVVAPPDPPKGGERDVAPGVADGELNEPDFAEASSGKRQK